MAYTKAFHLIRHAEEELGLFPSQKKPSAAPGAAAPGSLSRQRN